MGRKSKEVQGDGNLLLLNFCVVSFVFKTFSFFKGLHETTGNNQAETKQ